VAVTFSPRNIDARCKARLIVAAVVCAALTAQAVVAETYFVNPEGTGDFPTMHEAILGTLDGDVIQLGDGTYPFLPNTRLRFYGKRITLESESGDPTKCILEGGHEGYQGSAMRFQDGEDENCVVRGITLRKFGGGVGSNSALVIINDSSPTLENVRFIENETENSAGFLILHAGVRFIDCQFSGNRATTSGGGGTVTGTSVCDFQRCLFTGNAAGVAYGAMSLATGAVVSMTDCTIAGNSAGGSAPATGGVWAYWGSALTLVRTVSWGNCNGDVGVSSGGDVTFECCVVDSAEVFNPSGLGSVAYLGENYFADPMFCDPAPCAAAPTLEGDYSVGALSPALLAPCGPIGAIGQGCAPVSIESSSWGRIKSIHRAGK
jgi:hypothetical protein